MSRREQRNKRKKNRSIADWNKLVANGTIEPVPKCLNELVSEFRDLVNGPRKVFISGQRGTEVKRPDCEAEPRNSLAVTEISWKESTDTLDLPARELRTLKPITKLDPILPILRWGIMPEDPNSQMLECNSRRDLVATLAPSFNKCLSYDVTTSLIIVALPGLCEAIESGTSDWEMQQIIDEVFSAIKENGMLIKFDNHLLALFLLRVDQFTAGKVCQRIKEAVRRLAYLKLHLNHEPTLRFGISDHKPGDPGNVERLVQDALRNLELAEHLGKGAIVREVDKDLSLEHPRYDTHFKVGDEWLRLLKQNEDGKA